MADSRNSMLGELVADAELERSDFLIQATEQLRRFLESNRARISELGGLTLIDDDPDYLSVAPDLTFRSRSRYLDDETGQWRSETEVIETAAELVELYNPADVFQAFAEAAREAAGLEAEPTATEGMLEAAGVSAVETVVEGEEPYAAAANAWAETQEVVGEPEDEVDAARRLYDLALIYQERSQRTEAELLERFEEAVVPLTTAVGDLTIVDDDDERVVLGSDGSIHAEVVPEDADGEWRSLTTPDQLVEFYDPTDVFGDIADTLAEAWPEIAPELAGAEGLGEGGEEAGAEEGGAEEGGADEGSADEGEESAESEGEPQG